MKKMIILPVSIVAAIVVIGLAVWFLLPSSQYEQLPASKDMADTTVHLMELEKLLEQKSEQVELPRLCNCCNSVLIGGQCPICMGGCNNSIVYKVPHIPENECKQIKIDDKDNVSSSNISHDRGDNKY